MRWIGFVVLSGAGALLPAAADACGGCFCTVSATEQVDQSAERIVFEIGVDAETEQSTVTAHIQIAYTGDEDAFAWVVPVPALPREIDLSPKEMFDEIGVGTAPTFTFITNRGTASGSSSGCSPGCGAADRVSAGGDGDVDDVSEVTVWSEQNVGPFETVVLSSEDGDALNVWLDDNGYEIPLEADPIIALYAETGSFFLAMQLQEEADVAEIEPIQFTYDGDEPCIPLRLTAIATEPDLPVLAFVFADARVLPENFAQIEPDWNSLVRLAAGLTNYGDLVTAAADAAGGRAFVTEFAGPTSSIGQGGYYYYGTWEATDPTLRDIIARHPYLTRLYTTISANEMTIDPIFRTDPEAPDVSNFHTFDLTESAGILAAKRGETPPVRTAAFPGALGGVLALLGVALLLLRRRRTGS